MKVQRVALPLLLACAVALLGGIPAEAQGGVDFGLVGSFQSMENESGDRKYVFGVEIKIDGTYRWITEDIQDGSVNAGNGQVLLTNGRGEKTQLQVSFSNPVTLATVGPQGRAEWHRVGARACGGAA